MARKVRLQRRGKSPAAPFRHKGKVLLVFLFAAITVTGMFTLHDLSFEATSTLAVTSGRNQINSEGRAPSPDTHGSADLAGSAIETLKSPELIGEVISAIGVDTIYPDLRNRPLNKDAIRGAAILRYGDKLFVSKMDDSMAIAVSFRHRDPRIAADGVNRLVTLFKAKQDMPQDNSRISSLEKELAIIRQNLETSQEGLSAFRKKQETVSLDKQKRRIKNRRNKLAASLRSTEKWAAALKKKLSALKDRKRNIPENILSYEGAEGNRAIISTRAKLLALRLREKEMLTTLKKDSPPVVKLHREIDEMEKTLENEAKESGGKVSAEKNSAYLGLAKEISSTENELKVLSSRAGSFKRQIGRLDVDLRNLNSREENLQSLVGEVSKQKAILDKHVKKLEEAKKEFERERGKRISVQVKDKATVPFLPVIPNKRGTLFLAILTGACCGLISVFVFARFEKSILTPENAEDRLGLPVLTIISYKDSIGGFW